MSVRISLYGGNLTSTLLSENLLFILPFISMLDFYYSFCNSLNPIFNNNFITEIGSNRKQNRAVSMTSFITILFSDFLTDCLIGLIVPVVYTNSGRKDRRFVKRFIMYVGTLSLFFIIITTQTYNRSCCDFDVFVFFSF